MDREYELLEYRFSDVELLALGQQLARSNQQVYDLRAEKVSAVASLVASIKAAEKLSADLTGKIERKSEMREVEVISSMNRPSAGMKTIERLDNGEEVRVAVMTDEEREEAKQGALEFGVKVQ